MAAASVAIHLCIGSVYAWSVFNPPLMRVVGVVTPAGGDWTLKQVTWVFSTAIVFLGLSAAFAGRWLERVGPRAVSCLAALCWGGGFLIGAAGIALHLLWLVYLGYGVVGGCGLGLGYVTPVSTLIRWFPDRRGMAAGLAIMGFGGGSLIAAPLDGALLKIFYRVPVQLGTTQDVTLKTDRVSGRRYALIDGQEREVVVVTEKTITPSQQASVEAVYEVDTGSVGAAQTFVVLGVGYFLVMLLAGLSYRSPPPGWRPAGWTPPDQTQTIRKMISGRNVDVNEALLTPQFYFLWIVLCFNVTAGIGVLGVAQTMMTEIFGPALPQIVDAGFAAMFVQMIGAFNMLGRFCWASVSDYLGRKTTYTIFFVAGVALYLSIPFIAGQVSIAPAVPWLAAFYVVTMIIFTMYGGGFATIPAYLADLFGARYVGGIHGRLLTAWSTAGVLGPLAITSLRAHQMHAAIERLTGLIDPSTFAAKFGAPVTDLPKLVEAKTVTIGRLMEIAPPGTIDPSSTLYNTTMYLMAGLLAVALIANLPVRPVDPKHYLDDG